MVLTAATAMAQETTGRIMGADFSDGRLTMQVAVQIPQRLEKCVPDGFSNTEKALLLPDMDKSCGMISSPSFDFKSSIMLYAEKRELVFRKAQDKITAQPVDNGVPVETSSIILTQEQCTVIAGLFSAVVGSARDKEAPEPGEAVVAHLDGETYLFFDKGKAGKCWSPGKNSITGQLVDVITEISRYVRNHRPLSDELIEQVHNLAKQFSM